MLKTHSDIIGVKNGLWSSIFVVETMILIFQNCFPYVKKKEKKIDGAWKV